MNDKIRKKLAQSKRRIERRLNKNNNTGCERPMITASNIDYEIADRTWAVVAGGLGAMHLVARKLGLAETIDRRLHLLKVHLPYHESDHVLNIAYNLLAGGAAWSIWNCVATTRFISTRWAHGGFPTRPQPATSAVVSPHTTSTPCKKYLTRLV